MNKSIVMIGALVSLIGSSSVSGKQWTADAIENMFKPGDYSLWPDYRCVPLENIRPQEWRTTDDIIDGWDWSMPPHIKPSPRSLIGLQRLIGQKRKIESIKANFPVNPVTLHWITWRDIEPVEGQYNWDMVRERIAQARAKGSDSVLRMLTCSKAMGKAQDGNYSTDRGAAPRWLEKYNIPSNVAKKGANNENYDPGHPEFHMRYIKLINSFAKSGIPQMLKAAYVGYASPSLGDEGIGPHHKNPPRCEMQRPNEKLKHQKFSL